MRQRKGPAVTQDVIEHPAHYAAHSVEISGQRYEPIDWAEQYGFRLGTILTYLIRYADKGGDEDLAKAAWYLRRELRRGRPQDLLADMEGFATMLAVQFRRQNAYLLLLVDQEGHITRETLQQCLQAVERHLTGARHAS